MHTTHTYQRITETSWFGKTFHIIGSLWGKSTGYRWIPLQTVKMRRFDVILARSLISLLNKHSSSNWCETPRRSCDVDVAILQDLPQFSYSSLYHVNICMGMTFSYDVFTMQGSFCSWISMYVSYNHLRAKFVRGNKNVYLHFMSFLHIDMT